MRLLSKVIYGVNFMVSCTKDEIEIKSKKVLKKFLKSSSDCHFTQKKFLQFSKTIKKLQDSWIKYQEKKKNRMKFL